MSRTTKLHDPLLLHLASRSDAVVISGRPKDRVRAVLAE